jgi:hypothetical protein
MVPVSAGAVPILQLYVEGATYDDHHESWVFEPSGSDPIRLWVIGNVAGGGGQGTIYDVKISLVYDDPGTPVTFGLTPSTTGGYNGLPDPSMASTPVLNQIVSDGSLPQLAGGGSIPSHGVYGPGAEWQEFLLGDFNLTDSPIGDFIDVFPTEFPGLGQINVYELTVAGNITDLHIDAYNHVYAGNSGKIRSVFAPFSHDAGTGVNDPVPVPEPGALGVFLAGLLGLGLVGWTRRRR